MPATATALRADVKSTPNAWQIFIPGQLDFETDARKGRPVSGGELPFSRSQTSARLFSSISGSGENV
jgi:hypothetical protein